MLSGNDTRHAYPRPKAPGQRRVSGAGRLGLGRGRAGRGRAVELTEREPFCRSSTYEYEYLQSPG